jgi:hypothetical protein
VTRRRELGALEAANVHALLEAAAESNNELRALQRAALGRLDNLGEWLGVFSGKLAFLEADLAAIARQTARLEVPEP